jgi:hypothetical protein
LDRAHVPDIGGWIGSVRKEKEAEAISEGGKFLQDAGEIKLLPISPKKVRGRKEKFDWKSIGDNIDEFYETFKKCSSFSEAVSLIKKLMRESDLAISGMFKNIWMRQEASHIGWDAAIDRFKSEYRPPRKIQIFLIKLKLFCKQGANPFG